MLAFTENKKSAKKDTPTQQKRRDQKKTDKDQLLNYASESTVSSGGAVWHDPSVDNLKVNIEDSSRLRKLKKLEAESHITGEQYAKRLQEHYEKTHGQQDDDQDTDLFSWAKKPLINKQKQ